jgi:hypothetical protein
LAIGAGGTNLTIGGTGNVTVTGAVTEGINVDKALIKSGTGNLTLNGTYTSNSLTRVNDGTLFIPARISCGPLAWANPCSAGSAMQGA